MAVDVEKKVYEPAEFQIEDLDYLRTRDWSANWSEMGCFKTTTLEWLLESKFPKFVPNLFRTTFEPAPPPLVLIITTKAGKGTYYQTLPEVLPGWFIYNVTTKGPHLVLGEKEIPAPLPKEPKRPTIVLTHYQVFSIRKKKIEVEGKEFKIEPRDHWAVKMRGYEWDAIILDEAHRIKDRKAGWTKSIKQLDSARLRHVMTGTGFINNPAEIWSLLNFLNPKLFSSYWHFRQTFCDEYIDDAGFKKILGVKKEMKDDFRNLVRTVGPRRTKTEVFPNLPHPIYTPQLVELNPTQRKMYDEIKETLRTLDQKGAPIDSPNVLAMLNRLRQICVATPDLIEDYFDEVEQRRIQKIRLIEPSSKLDALDEILDGLEWDEERKDQVVIFSNFRDPIELAKARFDKAGRTYIHMQEKDNDRIRYQKWAQEFPKKNHQIFICTLQLGSESITLTSATTAIFLDRSWSPLHNEQGVSRVWRPGQEQVANIIHINARGTVDKRILDTNMRKVGWFREIFGAEEDA
jgi:hypothetical protein